MADIFKAIVIGSGAGGAPAAATLAERWGGGVAILEAGRHWSAQDFNQREDDMYKRLYVAGASQATEDGAMAVLQGNCVGGSTVINDALCFRPPQEMVERWRPYGVELSWEELERAADQVEQVMQVTPIPREMISRANYLVGLGAARLGWAGERLRHNSVGCVQCGFRHLGCAYNAKRSMNLSYVPKAVQAGAQLLSDTRVHHLVKSRDSWQVHCEDGRVLSAEHVVLAAGIVQSPTILLRSGIPAGEGLQVHLQAVAWGDFKDKVDGFNGIPMAYGVMEFADIYGHTGPGYLIEAVSVQPAAFAVQTQGQGSRHQEILQRYRHAAGALMLLRSSARGRIELGPGDRPAIHYPLVPRDAERTLHYFQRATELFMAAGAERVLLGHRDSGWLTQAPDALRVEPGRQYLYTAHPFGGTGRGFALDGEGRVKGQDKLWVLDASGFPEALGVNPQITIASLAVIGARRLLAGASG